ncbi:MAG: DUF4856 domain-containing protein [Alteromonadaceae bacterium]|nr:DUF4856 domain-containing protein [Alteromonadaceae bacterium]
MEFKRKALAIAVIIATSTLTACGSGGSDTDTDVDVDVVTPTNSAPTDISLSNTNVNENEMGAVIGTLSTTDADSGDTFTYSVDNINFIVEGAQLSLAAGYSFDFEENETIAINIAVTDSAGASFSKELTLNVVDVLDAYVFESKLVDDESSVSYSGQTARHVLIAELNHYIGNKLQVELDAGTLTSKADVLTILDKYYRTSPEQYDNFEITFIDNTVQTHIANISSSPKNINGKMAGNDPEGQHKSWEIDQFAGWGDKGSITPEGLIDLFFDQLADNAQEHINGAVRQTATGEDITKVYINTDGTNLKELIQKFLLVGITYSQATDDYLGNETNGKGLLSDHSQDGSKSYSKLEHQFDEGFGYFGAARDYLDYSDDEIANKGGREAWAGKYDSNGDGKIDLTSEINFGNSTNAAKRDRGSKDNAHSTDFTKQIMEAFIAGRKIINDNAGIELSEAQMTELVVQRDIAVDGWERAIVATVVHYINELHSDLGKMGNEDYSYTDVAKHFSELKGFALGIQFNPYSAVSEEKFAELHALLGNAPALEQEKVADYQTDLMTAREILATALNFDADNVTNW